MTLGQHPGGHRSELCGFFLRQCSNFSPHCFQLSGFWNVFLKCLPLSDNKKLSMYQEMSVSHIQVVIKISMTVIIKNLEEIKIFSLRPLIEIYYRFPVIIGSN